MVRKNWKVVGSLLLIAALILVRWLTPDKVANDLATDILGFTLVIASAATYLISGYRRTR
ncbi:hypothetical protein BVJ53_05720 [Lacticaseibacillus chiayiensis]|uniref:Uncharacterized protein n=1 Tax=Lacticaseibacillus chiayiensis TaxID=2100821 RepID=A0A4Q1U5L7_9LACO|nr:hypothetical protein [Lacticaseibacillus chiayiensis]RXT26849.1 hypothetical protein BVJ53_05720 [Lacticaseibacillus chiayiensis]UYN55743.1 hypothetical protein OFW50_09645 [Lacticaseibacillus chiayiensis]